jgi:hypothetical protein
MKNTLTQTFVADEWDETGEMGFRPERCSDAFDPINNSAGLAHDFIEHAGNFTVEGEIMAHASLYHLRYEGGFMFNGESRPLDLEAIAYEWTQLYHGIDKEGCLESCPEQPKLEEENEKELAEIVSRGKRLLLSEIGKEDLDTGIYAQMSQHFANWFRKGYREVCERYANVCAQSALIEADRYFKEALQKDELHGGERITISLDLDTGEMTFDEERECYECGQYNCEDCEE